MTSFVLMPALSPTMTEGNLSRWLVKEGDAVSSGDVLAEIETDKATMEVECVDEGVVAKLLVEAGTSGIAVNSLIAVVLEDGEKAEDVDAAIAAFSAKGGADTSPNESQKQAPSAEGAPLVATSSTDVDSEGSTGISRGADVRLRISPLAKKLASLNKLDIKKIKGSGPQGRIVKRDIDRVLADGLDISSMSTDKQSSEAGVTTLSSMRKDSAFPNSVLEPHSGMRKIIAERLLTSKQTIPHFYLSSDVEMDGTLAFRKQVNEQSGGLYKVSVNDIVVKALAHALMKEPKANAAWADEGVRYFDSVDVAVAVAVPGGLVTPVVRDTQKRGLVEISTMIKDFASRARDGKLMPEEYQGGTVSVSNLGMYGVDSFQAIINPPQSCILAVGQSRETAVFVGEKVVKRQVMTLTLSVDHRVVDGALAAQLLSALRGFLSNPATMIL